MPIRGSPNGIACIRPRYSHPGRHGPESVDAINRNERRTSCAGIGGRHQPVRAPSPPNGPLLYGLRRRVAVRLAQHCRPDPGSKLLLSGTQQDLRRCSTVRGTGEFLESQFDTDYWRMRADETRSVAQAMTNPAARREMHFIAEAYDRLADHAERTARRKSAST